MESVRAAGLSRTDLVLCDTCTQELPPFERATAFGSYGGSLRSLLHLYKFDGVRALRKPLGLRLADAMLHACDGLTGPVQVVAVPLYRGKRAFNQSAEMADEAVRRINGTSRPFTLQAAHGLLQRTRPTESQAHLSPQQRRTNVHGAFEVRKDVRGAQVLLVDDVYTTGATAMECTRVLLRAGALSVHVATLARTQRGMSATWDSVGGTAVSGDVAGWDVPVQSVAGTKV